MMHTYGARPLAEIASALMTPACRKRGVANVALMLEPTDLFGALYGRSAQVERIVWPRGSRISDGEARGATLVVRADGATALALQHVAPQIIERANILIGWPAISKLRLTQAGALRRRPKKAPPRPGIEAGAIAEVAETIGDVGHQDLKSALSRLGASVRARALSGRSEPT